MHPVKFFFGIAFAFFCLFGVWLAATAMLEPVRVWAGVNPGVDREDVLAGLIILLLSYGSGRLSFHLFTDR